MLWDEVKDLFGQGMEATDFEREALLAGVGDEVAAAVRALWDNAERAGTFLSEGVMAGDHASSYAPGDLVGDRFALVERLGAGGMGMVFSARDEQLGRLVALKFLKGELPDRLAGRGQLEREARAICSLTHPHICTLHDLAWEADTPFLVMEHLVGETLAARLARGPMPWPELVPIALELMEGLAYAHQAGIVHRDVKPANIMLTATGVKILDFGIAKQLPIVAAPAAPGTGAAAVVGTASYMSPEQAEGKSVGVTSDIFSVGCVLYEMITGRQAFQGESTVATLAAVLKSQPTPMPELRPDTPFDLQGIVATCLKKNPADRFQTVSAIKEAIDQLASVGDDTSRGGAFRRLVWPGGPASRSTVFSRRATWITAVVVAGVIMGAVLIRYYTTVAYRGPADSIVVLPFANVANDQDLEYLADGLSDSLTNALSRVDALRVIARTTAYTYKGKAADLRTVGHDLNVRAIVTGRVSAARDRLRVQADLLDATAGTQIWGQQYEGTVDDLQQIQEDLVRKVSEHLHLSDAMRQGLTRAPTSTPQAYQLYLRGRYALSRGTVADTQSGIDLFQRALSTDPRYALAYAGLADSYVGLSGMYLKPRDAMEKARSAAMRAMELEPALPEAHLPMALIRGWYDFAWRDAEKELERVIQLRPNDPMAHLWYAWVLAQTGRARDGIAQAQRAHELDPLSAFVETGLGQMYYCAGQYELAIQRLRTVVDSDPSFFNGHYQLGVAYLYTMQYREAIRSLEQARRLDERQAQPVAYLAYAYAKLGDLRMANDQVAELMTLKATSFVGAYYIAVASVGLASPDRTIQRLQEAYADREDALGILLIDPAFRELRTHPQFAALVRQVGLR